MWVEGAPLWVEGAYAAGIAETRQPLISAFNIQRERVLEEEKTQYSFTVHRFEV